MIVSGITPAGAPATYSNYEVAVDAGLDGSFTFTLTYVNASGVTKGPFTVTVVHEMVDGPIGPEVLSISGLHKMTQDPKQATCVLEKIAVGNCSAVYN